MTTDVYSIMQKLCAEAFGLGAEAAKTESYFVGLTSDRGEWNDDVAASFRRYTADIVRLSESAKYESEELRRLYTAVSYYDENSYAARLDELKRRASSL